MVKAVHIVVVAVTFIVALGVGLLIGFLSPKTKTKENPINSYYEQLIQNEDDSYRDKLANEIKAANIEQHLRIMTNTSHMAGTSGPNYGDKYSAEYVYNQWKKQELDYVKLIDYDVFLSYPDENNINSLEFIDKNGTKDLFKVEEPTYNPELAYSYIPRPFLAFAQSGSVNSNKIYYANYGRLEDFKFLESKGYNLKDSIVICRYGAIFRGNKVKLAAEYGAKGVLLYDDPVRSSPAGQNSYPSGEFLPKDGMQRGTLFTGSGDPLTPLYPSTENAFRLEENESKELPTIVAQVIGYGVAERIFKMMDGMGHELANETWRGSMNVTYTYGGLLNNEQSLTINVYNQRRRVTTYDVMGVIKGSTEPDRYVLVGNHRDAWVLGAIDPTSGTASLVEISRALNQLKKNEGWKPKRTIIFMSWGAEEYGLVGSTEFVEEFNKKLSANAVAYLNIDIAVQGNYSYSSSASPLLFDLIYDVTKHVKISDSLSVYDRWLEFKPNADNTRPVISTVLGSGSDHMGFQQRVGIACADSTFTQNQKDPKYQLLGGSYATYHSSYETFELVKKYIDPEFKSFKAIATVVAELARRLSDSLILPFNCNEYATEMRLILNEIRNKYNKELNDNKISLNGLQNVINNFTEVAKQFHQRLEKIDKTKIHIIRQYNEQLRNLEKSFLDFSGVSRNGFLHMLSAPSLYDSYGGDGFPALSDALYNAKEKPTGANWKEVRRQIAIAAYTIQSATTILTEPESFERYA